MAIGEFTVTSVSSPEAQVYVGTEGSPENWGGDQTILESATVPSVMSLI